MQHKAIDMDGLTLWNLPQVLDGTGIKVGTWYQLLRKGKAPRPVRVTGKRVAWVKSEVLAFRKQLIDARDRVVEESRHD